MLASHSLGEWKEPAAEDNDACGTYDVAYDHHDAFNNVNHDYNDDDDDNQFKYLLDMDFRNFPIAQLHSCLEEWRFVLFCCIVLCCVCVVFLVEQEGDQFALHWSSRALQTNV